MRSRREVAEDQLPIGCGAAFCKAFIGLDQLSVVARLHPGPLCSVLSSPIPFLTLLPRYTTCGQAPAIQAAALELGPPSYLHIETGWGSAARLIEALQSLWERGVWQLGILLAQQLITSLWQRIWPHDLHHPGMMLMKTKKLMMMMMMMCVAASADAAADDYGLDDGVDDFDDYDQCCWWWWRPQQQLWGNFLPWHSVLMPPWSHKGCQCPISPLKRKLCHNTTL